MSVRSRLNLSPSELGNVVLFTVVSDNLSSTSAARVTHYWCLNILSSYFICSVLCCDYFCNSFSYFWITGITCNKLWLSQGLHYSSAIKLYELAVRTLCLQQAFMISRHYYLSEIQGSHRKVFLSSAALPVGIGFHYIHSQLNNLHFKFTFIILWKYKTATE